VVAVMSTFSGRWNQFWFPDVPLDRVAIFRIAVSVFALIDVAFVSNYVIGYTSVDPMFFDPVAWIDVLGLPVPSATTYGIMTAVLIASLALASVGYRARYALLVAAPLYLYHWSLFNSWGKINHGKIPVVLALFVLILAPSAAALSVDAWRRRRAGAPEPPVTDPVAGWALRVVGVAIVSAYALSVVAKLRNTGISWVVEPVLQAQLLLGDSGMHRFLVDHPQILVGAQVFTIAVEATAVLVFLGGWVRNVLLATLAGFHLGSYVLLETEFSGFLVCYLAFFALERLLPPAMRTAPPDAQPASRLALDADVGR
jgi:hypothetical protein